MIPVDPASVGVLGGTFDPVHVGHVHVAVSVGRALGLREVRLVPAARPPHKPTARLTPARHRCAMLELAVADHEGLVVDRSEIERGGVSFTVETLRAMRSRSDRALPVFVLGLDALHDLPGWRESRALVEEFDLVAVSRPGMDLGEIRARLEDGIASRLLAWDGPPVPGARPLGHGGRIVLLELREIDVASTEIRRRVSAGEPIGALVPPSVARYILEQGLYRGSDGRGSGKEDER